MKTEIIIVDDHVLFNNGLKQILSDNFEIIDQIFDGKDLIPSLLKKTPKIVLLDINLPSIKGLELAKELKKSFPPLKVIIISMYSESAFVTAAKELDVDGYILKDSDSDYLISVINLVLEGEKVFDKKLNSDKPNLHHDDYFAKTYSLSKREVEIIGFLKNGNSASQIANLLYISFETVKSHKKNIYLKLNINKLTEVVQFAIDNNL